MPAILQHDITIDKGATYRQRFTWRSGSPLSPVDLTGYVARMHVREDFDSATTVIDLTEVPNGNGDVLSLGGVAGTVEIVISDETTGGVTVDGGVYAVELEAPSGGDVTRLLEGTVVFTPEVVR